MKVPESLFAARIGDKIGSDKQEKGSKGRERSLVASRKGKELKLTKNIHI